jgi:tRNA dimethylallyltransferase
VLVPVIVGPTAVGKTAVATALAALEPVEIVSADARQVYRELDIGTAKPSLAEREAAAYHGLDVVEPDRRYSAGRFATDASGWMAGIAARGRLPLVVGGSGLYLRALFEGLFAEPALDAARRERVAGALASLATAELLRWANRLDPHFRGRDRQRSARALEVALLTGRPLSYWQVTEAQRPAPFRAWYALLSMPRAALGERIERRTAAMLEAGLVDEVRAVLARGVRRDAPGLSGVGYREVLAHLDGRLPLEQLAPAIVVATRRYAKRQETWFRHQLRGSVTVLDGSFEPEALAREVLSGYRAAALTA